MADLSGRLPLTEGTNRVIDDPAGPSSMGAIASFISSALEGYDAIKRDVSVKKEEAAKARDKAVKNDIFMQSVVAQDRAVSSVVSSTSAAVANQADSVSVPKPGPDPATLDPLAPAPEAAVVKAATTTGQEIKNVQTAVEQGRMPGISLEAAMNAQFRKIIENHPDNVEFVFDTWKKLGIDVMLFRQTKDYADWADHEREAEQSAQLEEQKFRTSVINVARTSLGEASIGMSDNDLYIAGLGWHQRNTELELNAKRTNIALQQTQINEAGRRTIEDDNNNYIETSIKMGIYNDLVPFISRIQTLGNAVVQNPTAENIAAFQNFGVGVNAMIENYVNSNIQLARQNGYKGDETKLRAEMTAQFKGVEELFAGDHSIVKANLAGLEAIKTELGIATHKALPVYMMLKTAGMNPAEMPSVIQGLESNPELKAQLTQELNGAFTDFGQERASTHLLNAVKILKGQKTLRDIAPGDLGTQLKILQPAAISLAQKYVRGDVTVDGDTVINAIGELTIASRMVGPGSGSNTFIVATGGFANPNARKALTKALGDNVDPDVTRATIQASTAASANLLQGMQVKMAGMNKQNQHFIFRWDDKSGKVWVDNAGAIAFNKNRSSGWGANQDSGRTSRPMVDTEIPADYRKLATAFNMNLDNIVELNKVVPIGVKATDLQLRGIYGRNKPFPQSEGDGPVDIQTEIGKMQGDLQRMLDINLTRPNVQRKIPERDFTKKPEYQAIAPAVTKAANTHGVPEPVLSALLFYENRSFNPNAAGPVIKSGTHKGDRAMGLGQVMAKTAAAYGISDRASLSPDEQVDLAARILADNKKAGGDWKDAVSRYFTGVDYETAKKQGRTDGFTDVITYVERVV